MKLKRRCNRCKATFFTTDGRHKLCSLHRFMRKFSMADAEGQRKLLDALAWHITLRKPA